jgi:ABC-2 type transport system ATP-binding protein
MILKASNVVKYYGLNQALKSFSLEVPDKTVFALLGPNGAGKTTFIKVLLGLVQFESGEVEILGCSPGEHEVKKKTAYLPERFNFHSFYTAVQVVRLYGKLKKIRADELDERVSNAILMAGIQDLKNKKIGEMSKGQRQRVGIASLLVDESELIILDEPFSGLDPLGIRDLKQLITKLRDSGKTIFLNSHILSEVESLCDHYAIINNGELIQQGEMRNVLSQGTLEEHFYQTLSVKESNFGSANE